LGGNTSLDVSGISANIALPASNATFPVITLINDSGAGGPEIFYNFGNDTVEATTANYPLPIAVPCASFFVGAGVTKIAAITGGDPGLLRVVQANGPLCGHPGTH
jgi:hypothetical protein